MRKQLEVLQYERKKYGNKEVFFHLLQKVAPTQELRAYFFAKYLTEKDLAYRKYTESELRADVEDKFFLATGLKLDLDHPRLFGEKIQWLKLYDELELKTRLADKYLVRDWVKSKIGEEYLIPILGVWDNFDQIDFDALPDQFCLKMNHGSGMNSVVKDKAQMNMRKTRKLFKAWERTPFYAGTLELQYRDIPRKIIAEKYIEEMSGSLMDYKIHCFHGKPVMIQIICDRDFEGHIAKEAYYDINWNRDYTSKSSFPALDKEIEKPDNLDSMLAIAERLSEGLKYVRVDLYNLKGRILFGEMTFSPASGMEEWGWKEHGEKFGRMLHLGLPEEQV